MTLADDKIIIREVVEIEEFGACVRLQKQAFAVPDLETSPVRHLIVTKQAGGFTLGAFLENQLIGFVLSVPAFDAEKRFFYSHMTAVAANFQNLHVGARLKWAQRARALSERVNFIKWTFSPVQARNAFFNLQRLGAVIKSYAANFYGADYLIAGEAGEKLALDSDRLFAEWNLNDAKVRALSKNENYIEKDEVINTIEIPNDWNALVKENPTAAISEQSRIKKEFQTAFARNLMCRAFERDEKRPKYLLYKI